MTQKKLHPSVLKFKEFVKNNPTLIQEVRKGNSTWQELYEDWYLLGEDDKRWESIGTESKAEPDSSTESSKGDFMSNIVGMFKNMDANQMQSHLNNLSQAVGAIQGLLAQFQGSGGGGNPVNPPEGPKNPFSFRQD
ncbi:YlbD family protein [Neobacillus mesonae]|uniref:YlbD family protein n=1 Tax=Neobacillus mesonae TaxID=1193713 RepID=UPI0025740340|nr:YlbD family protein [Neobacillus mesonae]MED4203344.1 YlbD family protein [Neobacillus mesonae]